MANKRGDIARLRRKMRVRNKVVGTDSASAGLRISQQQAYLCAGDFGRSGKNSRSGIDAVGDLATTNEKAKGVEVAKLVGLALAKVCKEKNISRSRF